MRGRSGGIACAFAFFLGSLLLSDRNSLAQDARLTLPLSAGWRFEQTGAQIDAEKPGFADDGWQTVAVPHTWNRVGLYEASNPSHINTPADIDKVQGVGWYRLRFDAPKGFANQRAWLQFDAASVYSEVWLNGVRLGEHRGAFSRFRFDATAALRRGETNLLAVKTDNSAPAPGVAKIENSNARSNL